MNFSWFKLDPIMRRRLHRFRLIKRGYYSFLLFSLAFVFSMFAEVFINSRALFVQYKGEWFFPIYGAVIPGTEFGLDYDYETNYRDLKKHFASQNGDDFVILPPVPYNAFENDLPDGEYPPTAPSLHTQHFLGTDKAGRDVLARLVFGFRICILFSLFYVVCNYLVGVAIGSLMGYFGGKLDLVGQRLIEIWSNIPFLYIVMIVSSIVVPNFYTLALIMVSFGWMHMTWYMRTAVYKEKTRDYALAARSLGATPHRIVFRHIVPNAISMIVTFIPFSVTSGITALTALDYLGYGLPPPTPSWGEMLSQGTSQFDKPWIVMSVVVAMIVILTLVTFIGEAVREAFDPKKHTVYE
jgi:microcin C transport system permease protein